MKIAVLSDIHGNGIALKYVSDDLKTQKIDKVIILGDVVMKGPIPNEVMTELNKFNILAWIKGNTDEWFNEVDDNWIPETDREKELFDYYKYAKENMTKENIEFINNLPIEYSIQYAGIKILCVHGTPKSIVEAIDSSVPVNEIKEIVRDVEEDIILCGHSHCPFIGEVSGKKIFNTGSIGNSLDGDNSASYGILDFTGDKVKLVNKRISYPIDDVIAMAEKNNFPYLNKYKNMLKNAAM